MRKTLVGSGAARVEDIRAAADFLGPGAIETNRYQAEIYDMVRRRGFLGQRIAQTPATGHPSRYFEQTAIPSAAAVDPRVLSATASQPSRVERVLYLKALIGQINYSLFDVEVNQQQGQFAYLEAKDLSDTVDAVLKLHDQHLWVGSDTDLQVPTTAQYFGISGQIVRATQVGAVAPTASIASTASLVDGTKTAVAQMMNRTDFEVRPTAVYMNPLLADLFDQEAKTLQLYYNEVEVMPGVIVKALPTQAGSLAILNDPFIANNTGMGGLTQYGMFILTEEAIEYHWLTNPLPRVFQLGLLGNLAAQYVVVKFGGVVVKGASYAHRAIDVTRDRKSVV